MFGAMCLTNTLWVPPKPPGFGKHSGRNTPTSWSLGVQHHYGLNACPNIGDGNLPHINVEMALSANKGSFKPCWRGCSPPTFQLQLKCGIHPHGLPWGFLPYSTIKNLRG
ncbi:hypothetical protein C9439_07775 [archaeon SCG-AAA382B04]|nr:hypothetical protein C9439_07775 [archaeon SCG-AAA382B04]